MKHVEDQIAMHRAAAAAERARAPRTVLQIIREDFCLELELAAAYQHTIFLCFNKASPSPRLPPTLASTAPARRPPLLQHGPTRELVTAASPPLALSYRHPTAPPPSPHGARPAQVETSKTRLANLDFREWSSLAGVVQAPAPPRAPRPAPRAPRPAPRAPAAD